MNFLLVEAPKFFVFCLCDRWWGAILSVFGSLRKVEKCSEIRIVCKLSNVRRPASYIREEKRFLAQKWLLKTYIFWNIRCINKIMFPIVVFISLTHRVYLGGKGKVEVLMTVTSDLELKNGTLGVFCNLFNTTSSAAPQILIQHCFICRSLMPLCRRMLWLNPWLATWAFVVRRSTIRLDLKWTETKLKLNCLRRKFLRLETLDTCNMSI